jgi:hypothetical protein
MSCCSGNAFAGGGYSVCSTYTCEQQLPALALLVLASSAALVKLTWTAAAAALQRGASDAKFMPSGEQMNFEAAALQEGPTCQFC